MKLNLLFKSFLRKTAALLRCSNPYVLFCTLGFCAPHAPYIFLAKKTYAIGLFFSFISYQSCFALDDSLFKSMEMMQSANEYQAERVKIATENIANENSTGISPGSKPYRRKVIIQGNKYDRRLKANLVKVRKYNHDKSEFKIKYDPYHPAADASGYVAMPNVDRNIEKADIMDANRSYDAGLSVMEISKAMIQKTIETLK